MAIEDLIQDATRRMHKSVEAAQTEFSTLRTGRASTSLLDRVLGHEDRLGADLERP